MDSRASDATRCDSNPEPLSRVSGVSEEPGRDDRELRRLRSELATQERDIHDRDDLEHRQDTLIARLRGEAAVREADLGLLRERLETAEHELEDLRAIRDALTPPELPRRPGLELAAAGLPAVAERVSGDFYLVAEGPQDSTVLVVGDVVGHGLQAARRAAFIRTTFAATAPFSDDPSRLLSWANTALIERAGPASSSSPPPASPTSPVNSSCAGPRAILPRCGWMTAKSSRR